ncbi:sulfatase-like protein [Novosphingobium sp. PhB165]|uniref:LTA synthase family protein n=1 Tax=Novosphingobium sp. PhB165 TaxID=2485105 RepID=UPI0010E85074|nr:LTA synthase family protein [Novosphingobium sp. PhB165]TCM18678.1 sulfatase-like protein [Novosphingobium sp. PhB165]
MTIDGLTFAALLLGALLLDGLVRPRNTKFAMLSGRSTAGSWLLAWMMAGLFGLFLTCCGNVGVSAGLALAVLALLAVASNAKHAMLGEPLLFSDLALIGAIFRHPQFYLSAVQIWQRVVAGVVAAVLFALLAWLFVPTLPPHLIGLGILTFSLAVLALSVKSAPIRRLARVPDAHADVLRHGLLPVLLLYWLRWRESRDPAPCADITRTPPAGAPELVVVIQCESFADPAELFADPKLALPGLAAAREGACQCGRLMVSGFGAYTMRTEYGVLFGLEEDELGFRRYDPFLTALGEASYALPARLKGAGWRSLFLHPHDMRFYGRDRIMPAGGFAELAGEDRFAPPGPGEGRYVTDAAIADEIVALAAGATEPSLLYAVTIENHGPWAPDGHPDGDLKQSYLRLVRNSDAMLTTLTERLGALGRPALLVFFGDHRPSIPGATAPGGDRHTPYVMVRLDAAGRIVPGENRQADLTPAGLHHAILAAVLSAPGPT